MSASNPTAHGAVSPANDIWRQHERQIRDLYQDKNKTLKEVKEKMESNGFPKKPLSTWESKLRVDLKIRKKNKAYHWPLIYRHLTPRLERPGKKRLRQPTTIRFDGKEIRFEEVWKEIRRSGAHKISPRLLPQGGLPHGIEVRTPSPILSPPLIAESPTFSTASISPTSCISTAASQLYGSQTAIRGDPPGITRTISVFSNDTPTTPWISLCANLRHHFHDGVPARLLNAWKSLEWWKIVPVGRNLGAQDIQDFRSRWDLLPVTSSWLPRPSPDLGYRLVTSRGNISLSDFVSTSIYLLSNSLHDPFDGDKGLQLLCSLFEHDVHLFAPILKCELSTGRATWESLIEYSQIHQNQLMFRCLLDIGIRYEWLDPSDAGVLVSALEMDCPTDIVVGIIDHLCRAGNNSHWWRYILDAISIAHGKDHLGIAHTLVQRFDINAELFYRPDMPTDIRGRPLSVFLGFVLEFDSTKVDHWKLLDFFLSNGADVDKPLPLKWSSMKLSRWYNSNEISRALRPTILDHSFRLDRSLFERLAEHSKVSKSTVTKTGLLTSLEKGSDALRDYLKTRVPATHLFDWSTMRSPLEFLLGDQFYTRRWDIRVPSRDPLYWCLDRDTIRIRGMDVKIVRSLIEYGVDFNQHSDFLPDIHSLLGEILGQLQEQFTDDRMQLLDILVRKGADITESHLERAAEREGTRLLNWLRPRVRNFSGKTTGALAKAARLNNFEAVEFLLQRGADPSAFVDTKTARLWWPRDFVVRNMTCAALEQVYSVQAIAAGVGQTPYFKYCSLRMSQFLAERGAKLLVGPNDSNPFAFIMLLLEKGWGDTELFAKIKFVLSTLKQSKSWVNPPAFLLELCLQQNLEPNMEEDKERLKIFEYLLSEGAHVNPGSPLAALARAGGSKELVQRVLHLGAKLNAYTAVCYRLPRNIRTPLQAAASQGNEDLVYLFLEQGANVNSPARGLLGQTALQAICGWAPATEKEHRHKMTICDVLIKAGAEINAAPARRGGNTALQETVHRGDLELAAILVRNGAHVNAPQGIHALENCALDTAARYGRLDIAKLLLDANALSSHRGMTGYDRAIMLAQKHGHHALASLIRDHVANGTAPGLNTLDFQENAEDHHIYGYTTDGESSDDDYWPDDFDEPSTDDDWYMKDEDSSSSEHDVAEYGSTSTADGLTCLVPNVPGDAEAFPDSQVFGNALEDTFTGCSGNTVGLTEEDVYMGWENEPMPDASMVSLAETQGSQAVPDLQVVTNAFTDERSSNSGMGFVLTEDEMQMQWETDSMLQSALEPWVGMSDDSALWQRVFDLQDLEFGFETSGAGVHMSSSYHPGDQQE